MQFGCKAPHRSDQLALAAMVDIVFLLLIFFVLTFRITASEGEFEVEMPIADSDTGFRDILPIHIRLRSDSQGRLASVAMNDVLLRDVDRLRHAIRGQFGDQAATPAQRENIEVLLDCDYRLDYQHTIDAIDAVSGYVDDNGVAVPLITKVKFLPPRAP